jgi:hypothetical protein
VFCAGFLATLRALDDPRLPHLLAAGFLLGLTMTTHFMFIFVVAFLMAVLLVKRPAAGRRRISRISVLLAGFIIGLSPYLYLFWADGADLPLNYIDYTVEARAAQFGFDAESIGDPLERIYWLVSCREYERNITDLGAGHLAWQARRQGIYELGYHYGPLSLPLILLGLVDLLKKLRGRRIVILGSLTASPLFALIFAKSGMIPIFSLPLTLCIAIILSLGIRRFMEKIIGGRRRPAILRIPVLLLLIGSLTVVPHAIRYRSGRSARIPADLKYEFDQYPPIGTFVPSYRDHWEAKRYGESVLEAAPDSSMIIGKWNEIAVLFYLHHAEGMRRDITLDPFWHEHYIRYLDWQEKHPPATHPFVFLFPVSRLGKGISGEDTLKVHGGRHIYVYDGELPRDMN